MAPKKETSGERKNRAMRKVIAAFDEAIDPARLTPQEYIEFTGELISDLEIRLEAAVDERDAR